MQPPLRSPLPPQQHYPPPAMAYVDRSLPPGAAPVSSRAMRASTRAQFEVPERHDIGPAPHVDPRKQYVDGNVATDHGEPGRPGKEAPYTHEVIWAVREGSLAQVEALLQAGADVNTCEQSSGRTLLHLAVDRGDARFVALLLHHRPNVKAVDGLGETAFMASARANRPELARMIKQHAINYPPTTDTNNFQYVATWATDGTGNRMVTPANVSQNSSIRTYPQPVRYQEKTRSFEYSDHGYNTMTLPPPPPSSRGVSADTVLDSAVHNSIQLGSLRCLCEHMSDRSMPTPFLVGLFDKVGTKEKYTLKLLEELSALNSYSTPPRLRLNWILVLGPAIIALLSGYIIGLGAGWEAGLGFGLSLFFSLIFMVVLVLTGNRRKKWRWAIIVGGWLARLLRSTSIFMHTIFCNPRTDIGEHIPVRFITIHQPLSADTAVACLASAVDKTYQQIEKKYGSINSRLFRAFRSKSEPKTRFKSVCCIPNFIICIVFLLAFFTAATMLRVSVNIPSPKETSDKKDKKAGSKASGNSFSSLFDDKGKLACFIVMVCIVGLTLMFAMPTIYRALRGIFRPVRSRIKHYEHRAKADPDILPVNLKLELRHAAKLVHSFDAHLGHEFTRIVLILDGSNIYDQSKSMQCLNLLYAIFGDLSPAPFILVFAGDIQSLLSDNEMGLQEGIAHLESARIVLNLFLHLEDPAVFAGLAPDSKLKTGVYLRGGSSMESLSTTSVAQVPDQMFTTGKESLRSLTELILSKAELTELNMKHLPHLINTIVFKIRLLRLHQIEFKLLKVVIWVTLNLHWPFHSAWIIWYVEEQWEKLDNRVTLAQIYERIQSKMNRTRPLLKIFDALDRDVKKLDFLIETMGNVLTVGDIGKFLPLSLYVTPQLRKFIRNSLKNKPLMTPKMRRKSVGDIRGSAGCDLAMSPSSMSQLSSTWPRQVVEQAESATTTLNRTPSGSRRCLVKLKEGHPDKLLSALSIDEVCELLNCIEGFASTSRLNDYQGKMRDLNITGLVLSVCDMTALQPELGMTFGDWQLFHTLIMHLREQECAIEEAQAADAAISGIEGASLDGEDDGAPSPPPPPPPHTSATAPTTAASPAAPAASSAPAPVPSGARDEPDSTPGSVRSARAAAARQDSAEQGPEVADDEQAVWKKTRPHRQGGRHTTAGARLDRSWTDGGADMYAAGAVNLYSAGHREPAEALAARPERAVNPDRAHTLPQKPYQPPADLLFLSRAAKASQGGHSAPPPPVPPPPSQQWAPRGAQPFQHQQQCKHYRPPAPIHQQQQQPMPYQQQQQPQPAPYQQQQQPPAPFQQQQQQQQQQPAPYPQQQQPAPYQQQQQPTHYQQQQPPSAPRHGHGHGHSYSQNYAPLPHNSYTSPSPGNPFAAPTNSYAAPGKAYLSGGGPQGYSAPEDRHWAEPAPAPGPHTRHPLHRQASQHQAPVPAPPPARDRCSHRLHKQASQEERQPFMDRAQPPPTKAKSEERLVRRSHGAETPLTPTSVRSERRPRSAAPTSSGEGPGRPARPGGCGHHHHRDSESEEECTCEYWYRLEREGKVVLQQRDGRHPPPRQAPIPAPVLPLAGPPRRRQLDDDDSESESEEEDDDSAPTPPPHPPPKDGLRINRHQTEYL